MQAQPATPQFLTRLIAIGLETLAAEIPGASKSALTRALQRTAARWCEEHAGQEVYVPKRHGLGLDRDGAIVKAFREPGPGGVAARSPARVAQLARLHGLSARRVRAIVAAAAGTSTTHPPAEPIPLE